MIAAPFYPCQLGAVKDLTLSALGTFSLLGGSCSESIGYIHTHAYTLLDLHRHTYTLYTHTHCFDLKFPGLGVYGVLGFCRREVVAVTVSRRQSESESSGFGITLIRIRGFA